MLTKKDLIKISDFIYEIPQSTRSDMSVSARIFASEDMLEDILKDKSLIQLINASTLPGLEGFIIGMPDIHEGYGMPVGGVMATNIKEGIISPGAIGYDISCGVRLLTSQVSYPEIKDQLPTLTRIMFAQIPSGVGRGGKIRLDGREMDEVLVRGAEWGIEKNFGTKEDLDHIEERGRMQGADPAMVSQKAKNRGSDQLGTLGSGNHFLEIEIVEQIFDQEVARVFGLFPNQIVILIHSGSRGLGHQVCTDYVNIALQVRSKYNIQLPDRELACMPFQSREGQSYFAAQAAALNFALANRQVLAGLVKEVWDKVLIGKVKNRELEILYDVSHNIGKVEKHQIQGKEMNVLVHRKGATRSFGPGREEIPEKYQKIGQPVLIPGSMGTASHVLVGTKEAMEETFGTTAHGAGRRMSRKQAIREIKGRDISKELSQKGIIIACSSRSGVAEEAPIAYKDVDQIVEVVDKAGLSKKVAKLRPLGVVKGG